MTTILDRTDYFDHTFTREDFSNTELTALSFEECRFNECNFSEAALYHCRFTDCQFNNCNLSVIKVKGTRFMAAEFTECKLVGIDWTRAAWPNLQLSSPLSFTRCIVNDSVFFGLHLSELTLVQCKAHDVDFREGNFTDANFSGSDFSYSQFHSTNLSGADFSDAENYAIDLRINTLKGARFSRMEAVCLLESLDIELVD